MSDFEGKVHTIKCMLVGDSTTGKTHLFKKFTEQSLPAEYVPTVFDVCTLEVETTKGYKLSLSLWDSAGSHVYDTIRPISYAHTDCFILCYSTSDKDSFKNVHSRWLPEITKHGDGPTVPIILVATKCDLLEDNHKENEINQTHATCDIEYVPESEGTIMKEKIGAKSFFSCSTITEQGVRDILQVAIDLAFVKKEDEDKPSDPIWKFCSPTVVFMGDSGVGKSSLIQACIQNNPLKTQQGKTQTEKLQEYYHNIVKNGCEYFLRFVEIPCASEYLNTVINQIDVLVLCYAINDPFSFQSIELMFQGKLKDQLKTLPVILIGSKSELKNESMCVIPTIDGELLKQKMNFEAFIECSASTHENVTDLLGALLDNIKDQD